MRASVTDAPEYRQAVGPLGQHVVRRPAPNLHSGAANPGILLPVRSNSLGYANAEDIPRLGNDWATFFNADLKRLRQLTWLDRADPVINGSRRH